MATKDCSLLSNNKQQTFDGGTSGHDNQYNSINLNQNSKHTDLKLVQSQSNFSNSNNTGSNNETAASKDTVSNFADSNSNNFVNTSTSGASNSSWKKNDVISNQSQSLSLYNQSTSKKADTKTPETSNKNSSTLSLHIAAYENSIEGQNRDKKIEDSTKTGAKQKTSSKKLKDIRSTFSGAASEVTNNYEIPRQQPRESVVSAAVPEVMQFKASQKLLNPKESMDKTSFIAAAHNVKNVCRCSDAFKRWSNTIKTKFKNDEAADYISQFLEQFPTNTGRHDCGFCEAIYWEIDNAIEDCRLDHFKPLLTICIKANILKRTENVVEEEIPALVEELDKLNDAQLLFILKRQENNEGDIYLRKFLQIQELLNFSIFLRANPTLNEADSSKNIWYSVKKAWLSNKLQNFRGFKNEHLEYLMKDFEGGLHFMNMDANVLQLFFENLPPSPSFAEFGHLLKTYYSTELLYLNDLQDVFEDEEYISVEQKTRRLKTTACLNWWNYFLLRVEDPNNNMDIEKMKKSYEGVLQDLLKDWEISDIKSLLRLVKTDKDLSHMKDCFELLAEWRAPYELCPIEDLKGIPSSEWYEKTRQTLINHHFGAEVHEYTLDELVDQIFEHDKHGEIDMSKKEFVEIYYQYLTEYKNISGKNMDQMKDLLIPDEFTKRLAHVIHVTNLHFGFEVRTVQILAIILAYKKPETCSRLLQINTGEGKTNIIAMLAVLKALDGHKVDVITCSTELADDQSRKMAPFFNIFKLTTGNNGSLESNPYLCDIVYGDIANFKFHILFDEFEKDGTKCGRKCDFAILDEADSVMIDRYSNIARVGNEVPGMFHLMPILGAIWKQVELINSAVTQSEQNGKWYLKDPPTEKSQSNTEILDIEEYYFKAISDYIKPILRIEEPAEEKSQEIKCPKFLRDYVKNQIDPWIRSAISAHFTMRLNRHYTLEDDKITIVDAKNTGVLQHSTQWGTGLHQFHQMKHGCEVTNVKLTTNFISTSAILQRYGTNLIGLTGTAGNEIDKKFLRETYKTDCIVLPPYRKPKHAKLRPLICSSENEWMDQIVSHNLKKMENGQAVLIIAEYIEYADYIAMEFEKKGKKVFKYTKNEHSSVTQRTFKPGEVVVATNIGGRGTDLLVSEEVERNGGLHVCDTFFSVNDRVERQKIGRTSRCGKSGTSKVIWFLPFSNVEEVEEDTLIQGVSDIRRNLDKLFAEQRMKQIETDKQKYEIFKKFCELKDKMKSDKHDKFIQQALNEKFGYWLLENGDELSVTKFEKFGNECLQNSGEAIIQNPFIFAKMAEDAIIKGKLVQASSYLSKAIDTDPDFLANAYYWRGYVKVKTYNKDIDNKSIMRSAINDFKKAREIIEDQHSYFLQYLIIARFDENVQLIDQIGRLQTLYRSIISSIDAAIGKDVQKELERIEKELRNSELSEKKNHTLKIINNTYWIIVNN